MKLDTVTSEGICMYIHVFCMLCARLLSMNCERYIVLCCKTKRTSLDGHSHWGKSLSHIQGLAYLQHASVLSLDLPSPPLKMWLLWINWLKK